MSSSQTNETDVGASKGPAANSRRIAVLITLMISLIACFVSWSFAEMLRVQEAAASARHGHTAVSMLDSTTHNGVVSYGILGALLALTLGLIGGRLGVRRTYSSMLLAGTTGLVAGAASGMAVSYVVFPIYAEHQRNADLTFSLLIHLAIWATVGAAAGLAHGVGGGSRYDLSRSFLGGITGAGLATLCYDIAGAFLPLAHTERPLSQDATTRLIANLLIGLFVAGGIITTTLEVRREPAKRSPRVSGNGNAQS